MSEKSKIPNLSTNGNDYTAMIIRSIISLVPLGGPFLSELFTELIPHQRMDRVVDFLENLYVRLASLEKDLLESKLKNPQALELFEECVRQAASSSSSERHKHIANLMANSLSKEEIDYVESKHLLMLLNQIDDIEIIWLNSYHHISLGAEREFRLKHQHILEPYTITHANGSKFDLDKSTLQDNYKKHLARLDLIMGVPEIDQKTKQPKIDPFTHQQEIVSYRITPLGKLLIRQINLMDE